MPLRGVIQGPVADGAALPEDGPEIRRVSAGVPIVTHFSRVSRKWTLCGLLWKSERTATEAVCEACRVEASRMRAVLR